MWKTEKKGERERSRVDIKRWEGDCRERLRVEERQTDKQSDCVYVLHLKTGNSLKMAENERQTQTATERQRETHIPDDTQ